MNIHTQKLSVKESKQKLSALTATRPSRRKRNFRWMSVRRVRLLVCHKISICDFSILPPTEKRKRAAARARLVARIFHERSIIY